MATDERRRDVRIKVRFPCELAFARQRASGTVLDLSAGGLSVEVDGKAEQGDSVSVRLEPKGRSSIDIEAFVWNVRGMRRRGKGKAATRLGLVLSEAPDEFLDLLKSKAPRVTRPGQPTKPSQSRSPEPETAPETEAEAALEVEPPAAESSYRAHVKQPGTTRTRTTALRNPFPLRSGSSNMCRPASEASSRQAAYPETATSILYDRLAPALDSLKTSLCIRLFSAQARYMAPILRAKASEFRDGVPVSLHASTCRNASRGSPASTPLQAASSR